MPQTTKKIAAIIALLGFSQAACYNTYFITTTELEKLEANVEPQEFVEVHGDCPAAPATASVNQNIFYAQNEVPAAEPAPVDAVVPETTETATDAVVPATTAPTDAPAEANSSALNADGTLANGCTLVSVSAANPLYIVDTEGSKKRVTPFNFIMAQGQIVAPDYNLLEKMENVNGAEVSAFSTWKTVGTIVGVSAVAIGSFVAISVLSPDASGFNK